MTHPTSPDSRTDPAAIDLEEVVSFWQEKGGLSPEVFRSLTDAVEALRDRVAEIGGDKHAPVQGYSAGIPWSMHLRAYDMYCKKYSPQPALVDLEKNNCRGGFGTEELDEFVPGWRDELSKIGKLLQRAEAAEARASELAEALEPFCGPGGGGDLPAFHDILDDHVVWSNSGAAVTAGACRQARIALAATPADALERARALNELETVCRNILPRIFRDTGKGSDVRSRVALENALANLDALDRTTKEGTGS